MLMILQWVNKSKMVKAALVFSVWLLLGSSATAMCIWFAPPGRQFEPARNMKTLINKNGDDINLVVQPEFSGNATDFALVMPFPSQPEVREAPKPIFNQLENLTNPRTFFDGPIALESDASITSNGRNVTVIEKRDVGDYTATTLTATDATSLQNWLLQNGYQITPDKGETLDYYVKKSEYFVALKVNMKKADVDNQGNLVGRLDPVEFYYQDSTPELALKLMAGDMGLMTLTVYTLNDEIMYIPGAEIQFSRKVTTTDIKESSSLEEYDAWQKWLVRNVIQFNPREAGGDVNLFFTPENLVVDTGDVSMVLNPDLLPEDTGLIVSDRGEVRYSDPMDSNTLLAVNETSETSTLWVVSIILAASNVVLLILLSKQGAQSGRGK